MADRASAAVSGRGFSVAVLAVVLVYLVLATAKFLQAGPPAEWGGDVIQYIMHAQAIAEGRAYTDIPYIFNPQRAWIGPPKYPLGLPLFLAVPVLIHGPDPVVLGMYKIPLMAGAIVFTILICRQYLPGYWALLPGLLLALNPLVSQVFFGLLSEPLFNFLAVLSLYLGNRLLLKGNRHSVLNAIGLSATISAAILARTVGIVMFPALVVFGIVRYRRIDYLATILTLILSAGVYLVVTNVIADPLQDYTDTVQRLDHDRQGLSTPEFAFRVVKAFIRRLPLVPPALSSAWLFAPANLFFLASSAVCFLLIGAGFLVSIFREIRLSDVFYVGYISLLLVAPFGVTTRLLFPVMPLTLIYLTIGIFHTTGWAARLFGGEARYVRVAVPCLLILPVLAMLLASHLAFGYVEADRRPNDAPAKAMVAYIERTVPRGAVLVSSRPRTMYHLTGRVGSAPPFPLREAATIAWMKHVSARYLLLIGEDFDTPPETLRLVHTEGYLKLYVLPAPGAGTG